MSSSLVGKWGEAKAASYLCEKGYKIEAVNFHSRFGELDIVARKKNILAFVEVKLRKNSKYGAALEFVNFQKQNKLRLTAEVYLQENNITKLQPRFDVIEIYAPNGISEDFTINHIENAFE